MKLTIVVKHMKAVVAPFAGAWIEIKSTGCFPFFTTVAPFAGAWIEIPFEKNQSKPAVGRTLRGCVD